MTSIKTYGPQHPSILLGTGWRVMLLGSSGSSRKTAPRAYQDLHFCSGFICKLQMPTSMSEYNLKWQFAPHKEALTPKKVLFLAMLWASELSYLFHTWKSQNKVKTMTCLYLHTHHYGALLTLRCSSSIYRHTHMSGLHVHVTCIFLPSYSSISSILQPLSVTPCAFQASRAVARTLMVWES